MNKAGTIADGRTWDYLAITEVTIDRPAREVWPYFFGHKRELWSEYNYVVTAGESGQVGEIYETADSTLHGVRWIMETIRAEPERLLVLKMLYQEADSPEQVVAGCDIFEFTEVEGHTTAAFRQFLSVPRHLLPQDDLDRETKEKNIFLARILQTLKRMVENGE
jgi:uncharacterized protein YndB with AHSA1/START domain